MNENRSPKFLLGILGAIAGGVLGYFLFAVLIRQGLYPMPVPGALIGLGCGLASRIKSLGLAIFCGIASLVLGLLLEWKFKPFIADDSLSYFLAHLGDLTPATFVLIGLGCLFGFWFGLGREGPRPTPAA